MTAIRLLSDCVHQKLTCAEKEQLVNTGPNKTAKRTCLNSCIGKKSMEIKALGKIQLCIPWKIVFSFLEKVSKTFIFNEKEL